MFYWDVLPFSSTFVVLLYFILVFMSRRKTVDVLSYPLGRGSRLKKYLTVGVTLPYCFSIVFEPYIIVL